MNVRGQAGPEWPADVADLLRPFFELQRGLLLDGGLATELERRGHVLESELWSARLLTSAPEAILEVHRSYLEAGADVLVTATYQASLPGFEQAGLGRVESERVFRLAIDLARRACSDAAPGRHGPAPLVAASVGPYGAYLADGSEYRGDYGLSREALMEFHAPRWELLLTCGPDLMACETIPSFAEVQVLAELSRRSGAPTWMALACKDGERMVDGTPVARVARWLQGLPTMVAFGVNCSAPVHVGSLLEAMGTELGRLPLLAYPNSGESYDPSRRAWCGPSSIGGFVEEAELWWSKGARLIGGCCRTGPDHTRALGRALFAR